MPLFIFTDASFKIARCVEVWRKSIETFRKVSMKKIKLFIELGRYTWKHAIIKIVVFASLDVQ